MENVVLTIHLILALLLIVVVLIQRSEGGGLGMGGGGGGGAISSRAAATALGKATWILATAFIVTSITLTILAAQEAGTSSVIDQLGGTMPTEAPVVPSLNADDLLPPTTTAPAAPPAASAPAAPPASN